MEGLLETYLNLLSYWKKNFSQNRSYLRATSLAISFCLTLGRKTLTRALCAAGLDQEDWTACYRLFSRRVWSPRVLFRPVLEKAHDLFYKEDLIAVAYDDTLVRKTGKKIKDSSWQRDPLSPPFCVNFVWGMRYLQASLLVPLYNRHTSTPPRGLPVQFEQLPKFKKPSKKASAEQWQHYKNLAKQYNTSTTFVRELRYLRRELDSRGLDGKMLLATCDGSFCNRTCFSADLPGTNIVARVRKNARLYRQATKEHKRGRGASRFYDPASFTPEEFRKDESTSYKTVDIFYGGKYRRVRYKELKVVYWKWGTKRKPLRLLVIAPTPYSRDKCGKLRYREAAYLLSTDLTTPADVVIQKYFDRWQIEVNFKEEKSYMGLGEQQVWSARSIPRLPAFIAACYSLLLLASILRFKDQREAAVFVERPKWRRQEEQGRPSCIDLLALLRKEALGRESWPPGLRINPSERSIITKAVA